MGWGQDGEGGCIIQVGIDHATKTNDPQIHLIQNSRNYVGFFLLTLHVLFRISKNLSSTSFSSLDPDWQSSRYLKHHIRPEQREGMWPVKHWLLK